MSTHFEVVLSSEVADDKEGKMHRIFPRVLGGTDVLYVCRLDVVYIPFLWPSGEYDRERRRNKKENGGNRQ